MKLTINGMRGKNDKQEIQLNKRVLGCEAVALKPPGVGSRGGLPRFRRGLEDAGVASIRSGLGGPCVLFVQYYLSLYIYIYIHIYI